MYFYLPLETNLRTRIMSDFSFNRESLELCMEQVIYWATSSVRWFLFFQALTLELIFSSAAGTVLQEGELGVSIIGLCHSEHYIFHQVPKLFSRY